MDKQQRMQLISQLLMCSLCCVNSSWLINLANRPDLERKIEDFLGIQRQTANNLTKYVCPLCIDSVEAALLRKHQDLNAFSLHRYIEQGQCPSEESLQLPPALMSMDMIPPVNQLPQQAVNNNRKRLPFLNGVPSQTRYEDPQAATIQPVIISVLI